MHIVKGENLLPADNEAISNPYCRIRMLTVSSSKDIRKTKSGGITNDPHWDETFEYKEKCLHTLARSCLEIKIYHKKFLMWKGKCIGGVRLNLGPLQFSPQFKNELYESRTSGKALVLPTWMDGRGDETTLWYGMLSNPGNLVSGTLLLRRLQTLHKNPLDPEALNL